ncbi:sulfite exporter TauE/SafE family protein [Bergeriella denitrificans]|uniref:Probable membrane transporter protein n=1 Tax=Bergeriella denitrificans TaxID=494 RepID=A0A378UIW1_BERDE|nr:sulfite exporter TauE/SafE family protein [Bergeriella denitrificans]STZ77298.1 Sulfite exporter TauE/SafE [Bergeriella denitrificans]
MPDDFLLAVINFATSTLTAITGAGGGMILIAVMPFFIAPQAMIPLHGATQLSSNASRAWFGRKSIDFGDFRPFLIGSLAGAAAFGVLVNFLRLDSVPLFIGVYILLSLWSARFNHFIRNFENFYVIGFMQTGLSVFVGAPGPLALAMLHRRHADTDTVVSTAALMMAVSHVLKMPVYVWLGFRFSEYLPLMLMMIAAAALGSYAGTRLRHLIPAAVLKKILHWLLTLLAVQLIAATAWRQGWLGL